MAVLLHLRSGGRTTENPGFPQKSCSPLGAIARSRALVCAVIEQDSCWNPWAMRYEPAFFSKYVAGLYTNSKISVSEAYARGFSCGLMQGMGQLRAESGFDAPFLSALCDPEQGLAIGCKILRKKFDAMAGDATRALLAWNGEGNLGYAAQVFARCPRRLRRRPCQNALGHRSSVTKTKLMQCRCPPTVPEPGRELPILKQQGNWPLLQQRSRLRALAVRDSLFKIGLAHSFH